MFEDILCLLSCAALIQRKDRPSPTPRKFYTAAKKVHGAVCGCG